MSVVDPARVGARGVCFGGMGRQVMGEGDKGDKGGMYYWLKKLPEGEGGRGRRSQKRRRGTIFEPIPCRRSWIPLPQVMGTGDPAGDRKCRTRPAP